MKCKSKREGCLYTLDFMTYALPELEKVIKRLKTKKDERVE